MKTVSRTKRRLKKRVFRSSSTFFQATAIAFLSQPNPGKFAAPSLNESNLNSISSSCASQSPLQCGSSHTASSASDVHTLRDEVVMLKTILSQWQERVAQARSVSATQINSF